MAQNDLLQSARSWRDIATDRLQRTQAVLHRHPHRVAGAVLALLAGTAVTAFGVAPLTTLPNTTSVAVTQVSEPVESPLLKAQIDQLDLHVLSLFRSDQTRTSDTVDTILKRLGIDDAEAAEFLRKDPVARTLLMGRAGKMVKAKAADGKLVELVARGPAQSSEQMETHFTRLTIARDAQTQALTAHTEQAALTITPKLASGLIQSSLYAAADDAHVPDSVTNQMAEIFGTDIDFRRELRKGDAFSVLYEAQMADGEPISWGGGAGRVLAARFINKDKTHDAVWFQEAGHKGAYYDLSGRSKTRAFLASPLAFSRVTSGFAMRFHPILQQWKAHLGVDYGAPTGTPVRSVGNGRVTFAGQQRGYGNVIQIQHSGDRMTVYAHLSRIGVRMGQTIEQGQQIGNVGATGWATGPHLHFEFKVSGRQIDPMTIARASESTQLSTQALAQFRQMATTIAQRLQSADQQRLAASVSATRVE